MRTSGGSRGVEGEGELVRGDAAQRVKVHRLPEGVHARVGAARPGDGHGDAGEARQRLLHHLLYGQRVALPLPAGVIGAVVFHDHADPASSVLFHAPAPKCDLHVLIMPRAEGFVNARQTSEERSIHFRSSCQAISAWPVRAYLSGTVTLLCIGRGP